MLFTSQAYLAALNALFAEHFLGYVELVQENTFTLELKTAVITVFKIGDKSAIFDERSWVAIFNHADRLIQLNFIASGLNELGQHPMLTGENWQPVRNAMVIRNIGSKMEKANRYILQRHGKTVSLRDSKLAITDWGIADLSDRPSPPSEAGNSPSVQFEGFA